MGATDKSACDICDDYCHSGTCSVNSEFEVSCDCDFGWRGRTCDSNVLGFGMGIAFAGLLVLILCIYAIYKVGVVFVCVHVWVWVCGCHSPCPRHSLQLRGRMHYWQGESVLKERLLADTKLELEEVQRAWNIDAAELTFVSAPFLHRVPVHHTLIVWSFLLYRSDAWHKARSAWFGWAITRTCLLQSRSCVRASG